MTTPAHEVATYLAAQIPSLAIGTVLRVGRITPVRDGQPALGVWVDNQAGLPAFSYKDGGRRGSDRRPGILVTIRGEKDRPGDGMALSEQIRETLEYSAPGSLYDLVCLSSGVASLGFDGDGFPLWTITLIGYQDSPSAP